MSVPVHPFPGDETAAEYAQAHQCFQDYQDFPYRFQDQTWHLKDTIQQVGSDGLVHQAGLSTASFPQTTIELEIENGLGHAPSCISSPSSQTAFPVFMGDLTTQKGLRIPSESLDLGYGIKTDIKQYLEQICLKSSCNILNEWLPLTPVNIDNDEGELFSAASSRWQKLARRELERETFEVTAEAKKLIFEPNTYQKLDTTAFEFQPSKVLLEPVSPLLSSSPELDDFFVPSPRVTVVDLTSEPSSPVNPVIIQLQDDLQNDTVGSTSMIPTINSNLSPLQVVEPCLWSSKCKMFKEKFDVPLVSSSPLKNPDNTFEMPSEWVHGNTVDSEEHPSGCLGHFNEALESIMEACHDSTNRDVEGERLDAKESCLRMQVPPLDFDICESEWRGHLSSPGTQFKWMLERNPPVFHLEPTVSLLHLGKALKWAPIPSISVHGLLDEPLQSPGPAGQQYLAIEFPPLSSKDFVTKTLQLSILNIEDEIELEVEVSTSDNTRLSSYERNLPTGLDSVSTSERQSLDDIAKSRYFSISRSLKRKVGDESSDLLSTFTDSNTTSKLLSSFIQLRCPLKAKFPTYGSRKAAQIQQHNVNPGLRTEANEQSSPLAPSPKPPRAPAPEVSPPVESCTFIISMALSRVVISHIEKAWPQLELIDKDFSHYNKITWSPGSAQRNVIVSQLSYEADISLSPGVGIILTTMLKVKQRPLPGSKEPTALRHTVEQVSQKYEELFILVSEANPQGEYVGNLSASDMIAFNDFVQFTSALQAGITVRLVHGAEETISKWALELMARFSAQSSKFSKMVSSHDSTWGLFLRRTGINVFASQVLERLLANEYGDLGLDRFVAMSREERISKYQDLLGGTRVLTRVCVEVADERV
ncbi:hypothetical protein BGZ63DRAFT_442570 [Mariannaea sp. PMI_226]|nr:hypothetical protein BGZ63DRAFT_442570 [Mariannaea sp. PMI_226]